MLGVLVGFSRRQVRLAELQARQAERDQQRAELLADRSRAARDVHDVLAHSLGGLVLQLDAVEALLEAGRVEDATRRAADARTLAVDGLAEARRAVRALREDDPAPPRPTCRSRTEPPGRRRAGTAATGLAPLVDAHRSFGGELHVDGDLTLAALDPAHRAAVVAATREALSNARRHAPGRPVTLQWCGATRPGPSTSWSRTPWPTPDTGWSGCVSASPNSAATQRSAPSAPTTRSSSRCTCPRRPVDSADRVSIRVLVVDDQAIVRDGLVTVLSLVPDLEVVGEAADGAEAVALVAEHVPDVVLMDLRMPVVDGPTATAQITAAYPGVAVLVLTTFADDASIMTALAPVPAAT